VIAKEARTLNLTKEEITMKRMTMLTVAGITAAIAVVAAGAATSAQDKYTLKLPNGIPFSDFRGYENWQVVSVSQTPELLKVEVANPTMIDAYRAGIPGNGKSFPEGSKIAKIEWKLKKMVEAPFAVNVPDTLQDVFLIEKDSKRFPDTKGWGYAVFDYQPTSDTFKADPTGTVNCGFACHTIVKDKDYIFHSYQKR
jgi:Cytochrome P460